MSKMTDEEWVKLIEEELTATGTDDYGDMIPPFMTERERRDILDLSQDKEEKKEYTFETYIRPFDGVECEATTGIEAEVYESINLPDKIKDSI